MCEVDKKERNAGFTLVELLIAVVILSIIVVPFAHAVLSSVRTNARARRISDATVLAQSEMEKLQAESMEAIKGRSTEERVQDSGGNTYCKQKYNVQDVVVGGTTFDIEVELSEDVYDVTDSAVTDYNENEIAQIYDMNEVTDAFYIQDAQMDGKMAARFPGDKTVTEREMKREIVLDITQSGTAQEVELDINYTSGNVTKSAFSRKQRIYDSTSQQLRNIYLFYQGMSYYNIVREDIVIRNYQNIPVNVYLIRQNDAVTGGAPPVNYKMEVRVLEPGRTDADYFANTADISREPVKVATHIRTNLSYDKDNLLSPANQVVLSYSTAEQNPYLAEDKIFMINGIQRACHIAELIDYKDLSAKTAETRVYKVVIKVYEDGKSADEALATIDGTKKQ